MDAFRETFWTPTQNEAWTDERANTTTSETDKPGPAVAILATLRHSFRKGGQIPWWWKSFVFKIVLKLMTLMLGQQFAITINFACFAVIYSGNIYSGILNDF
jgi:hypothetical protein